MHMKGKKRGKKDGEQKRRRNPPKHKDRSLCTSAWAVGVAILLVLTGLCVVLWSVHVRFPTLTSSFLVASTFSLCSSSNGKNSETRGKIVTRPLRLWNGSLLTRAGVTSTPHPPNATSTSDPLSVELRALCPYARELPKFYSAQLADVFHALDEAPGQSPWCVSV